MFDKIMSVFEKLVDRGWYGIIIMGIIAGILYFSGITKASLENKVESEFWISTITLLLVSGFSVTTVLEQKKITKLLNENKNYEDDLLLLKESSNRLVGFIQTINEQLKTSLFAVIELNNKMTGIPNKKMLLQIFEIRNTSLSFEILEILFKYITLYATQFPLTTENQKTFEQNILKELMSIKEQYIEDIFTFGSKTLRKGNVKDNLNLYVNDIINYSIKKILSTEKLEYRIDAIVNELRVKEKILLKECSDNLLLTSFSRNEEGDNE